MAGSKYTFDSAIRGFHLYKTFWTPVTVQELTTERAQGPSSGCCSESPASCWIAFRRSSTRELLPCRVAEHSYRLLIAFSFYCSACLTYLPGSSTLVLSFRQRRTSWQLPCWNRSLSKQLLLT